MPMKHIDLGLNVSNLLDKKYTLQKADFDTVAFGMPRKYGGDLELQILLSLRPRPAN